MLHKKSLGRKLKILERKELSGQRDIT